MSRTCKV